MSVTVRDIAKRLNIGKSTVGYALNGGPKQVSEDVRRLVLQTAKEMGYRPNENARALAKGRTNMIGVVPFQLQRGALNSPFIRAALGAIYDEAEDLGRHVVLFTGYDPNDLESMRSRSFEARVDGVVLIAPKIDQAMLSHIAEQGVPFAVVAGPSHGLGLCFNADNIGGVRQVVDHLVDLGHRRIGAITGHLEGGDANERHEAFVQYVAEHGLALPPHFVERGDFSAESGYAAGKKLLAQSDRPSAVFVENDLMALGVMRAANELGISIPHDLSLVGFDDDEVSAHLSPGLTTIRQPIAEMAAAALDAVVRLGQGEEAEARVFPTKLIVRASTASPKEDIHSCDAMHSPSSSS